jgi:tetraacyldisaccharide 4'-kinase
LLNPLAFHDVISGRRRDWRAAGWRSLLQVLEPAYAAAVTVRNSSFDARWKTIHRVAVPVISVGNITAGGTGKTPFVAWMANWLSDHSQLPAIVSRGYRAQLGARNDEALELELLLPQVPHVQNPDRVAAAQQAIEEFRCQVILLDDGFQHRRLHRDLDVVLIDALNPFGFEHLLPRGLLREPLRGLRRADVVGLSRANLVDDSVREKIWSRVTQFAPQAVKIHVEFLPHCLRSSTGQTQRLDQFHGQQVLAFCGIGNPQNFTQSLALCGIQIAAERFFPDHHPYGHEDRAAIAAWAEQFPQAEALICTEKDWGGCRLCARRKRRKCT